MENIHSPAFVRSAPATSYAAAFAPMLANLPATTVTSSTATLNGTLVSTGGSATAVTIYHGTTDGGTTAANWTGSINLGARSVGNFGGAISGLPTGTVRYFRAFASNATGGTWAPVTSNFITACAEPGGLTATPARDSLASWNTTPGAVSYQLKRSATSGGPYATLISGILGTTATDPGATAGGTQYYVVSASNAGGESTNSAELAVSTLAAPATLTATAGNNSVALTWSSVAGATSYTLYRATSSGGPLQPSLAA